jgi:hypothetical protein
MQQNERTTNAFPDKQTGQQQLQPAQPEELILEKTCAGSIFLPWRAL